MHPRVAYIMTMQPVIVRSAGSFRNEIEVGPHRLIGDEPIEAGGGGEGPPPYEFLAAGPRPCTSMTPHLYAKRGKIPPQGVESTLLNHRMHAKDCPPCPPPRGSIPP